MQRLQQTFKALGSEVYLTLVGELSADAFDRLFDNLHQTIVDFETRFSRFSPDSELTQFNAQAGQTVSISPPFHELLVASRHYGQETSGLYSPFVLPALQAAGYRGSWPRPDRVRAGTDFSDGKLFPIEALEVQTNTARIPPQAALDFGGIGKGYLLDRLHEQLRQPGLSGYWLSLGGDILCGGYDLDHADWQLQVQNVHDDSAFLGPLANQDGTILAVATSGVTKRRGESDKGSWHHIIDPRTGQPADTDILTATVTADTGAAADVFAKCIVIAGDDEARRLQRAGRIRDFILQYADKEATFSS